MSILSERITALKNEWTASPECPVGALLDGIKAKGKLRQAQIDAIEVYLFLKMKGENKPLRQLFSEGFFVRGDFDLDQLDINRRAHAFLRKNKAALALYEFAQEKTAGGGQRLPALARRILEDPQSVPHEDIIREMFYGVSYADYLFSLPMGAGKTFLMAAMIYLDLYYASKDQSNPHYAHNFLVLIPSGLKSSITDSLRDIANFDGGWVLPQESADAIKEQLKFDVLDVPKSGRKSNITKDPNTAKVSSILPAPYGQIFVVNAEKLILDSRDKSTLIAAEDIPNELRRKLAEMPNLALFMDEVHHATKQDIRLRQVVNWWAENDKHAGNIVNVLSFTGTPYLSSAEKIDLVEGVTFSSQTITNTVYYYPLVAAVSAFLKRPTVRSANLPRRKIIELAVRDFEELYGGKTYADGTIAKCAIYCSSIAVLETEVYPLLRKLGIDGSLILKYHQGSKDKKYTIPAENATAFRALDTPESRHRYVLLVQIGKEGWNCKSLTAVVLSGENDSRKNMVLQTCCRCLRQVDGGDNTALIWLNEGNAKTLDKKLSEEQSTSIEGISAIERDRGEQLVPRRSRLATLQLPGMEFYQLRIRFTTTYVEKGPNTGKKLDAIFNAMEQYRSVAIIKEGDLGDFAKKQEISDVTGEKMPFHRWLALISKNSFGRISFDDLMAYQGRLRKIYDGIDGAGPEERFDLARLNSDIALAFSVKRQLNSKIETIRKEARMLLEKEIPPVANTPALYPDSKGAELMLQADDAIDFNYQEWLKARVAELVDDGKANEIARHLPQKGIESVLANKDRSFHYIPYNFSQSTFERDVLEEVLTTLGKKRRAFEIYYNGERGLTDFVIECYQKQKERYHYLGRYTPDFLLIQRKKGKKGGAPIHKVLILETKGKGYAHDPDFVRRKEFVSGEFIKANNEKFGYDKFDFLYIEDSGTMTGNLKKIARSVNNFFSEETNAN